MTSNHYKTDRQARESLIQQIGVGTIIKTVKLDKGHKNGPEIHKITNTGIIIIYNAKTNKMVTKLIARPAQIKRYYKDGNAPKELIEIAIEHTRKGYNMF